MSKELQVFKFNTDDVRTIIIDNEPWFVAKDVCDILKHTNTSVALNMIDDDERSKLSLGRQGETNIISESGVYVLALKSKTKDAKIFRKWVTSELLPAVRKGELIAKPKTDDEIIREGYRLICERVEKLEQQNKRLIHDAKTYTTTEIAKELNMRSAVELNKKLEELGIQYKQNKTWVLIAKYSDQDFTSIKQQELDNGKIIYNRHWTGKGRDFLLNFFKEN